MLKLDMAIARAEGIVEGLKQANAIVQEIIDRPDDEDDRGDEPAPDSPPPAPTLNGHARVVRPLRAEDDFEEPPPKVADEEPRQRKLNDRCTLEEARRKLVAFLRKNGPTKWHALIKAVPMSGGLMREAMYCDLFEKEGQLWKLTTLGYSLYRPEEEAEEKP